MSSGPDRRLTGMRFPDDDPASGPPTREAMTSASDDSATALTAVLVKRLADDAGVELLCVRRNADGAPGRHSRGAYLPLQPWP
jgi:hypothetical protein